MKLEKLESKDFRFDINDNSFYLTEYPKDRTKLRLFEIAQLGMKKTGHGTFGYAGVNYNLYLEILWIYSDEDFNTYINWVKKLIHIEIEKL